MPDARWSRQGFNQGFIKRFGQYFPVIHEYHPRMSMLEAVVAAVRDVAHAEVMPRYLKVAHGGDDGF